MRRTSPDTCFWSVVRIVLVTSWSLRRMAPFHSPDQYYRMRVDRSADDEMFHARMGIYVQEAEIFRTAGRAEEEMR